MQNKFSFYILLMALVSLGSCAKKGTISGGAKDEIPPRLISASPVQNATNFKAKEIKIYFDEYIKLKDLNKNLIISPPLKYKPLISPMGAASKYIKIKIRDTLKANTTYIFNFGQSVVDNNEGNVYPNFSYVFSTGNVIDSLSFKGTVQDILAVKDPKNITVMLYEMGENYTDSIVYKEKPNYLTNTFEGNSFMFHNLKAGKYRLVAITDLNNNQKYNPKTEQLAFESQPIILPDTTAHTLKLFKAVLPFKSLRAKQESKGKILFPFEGDSTAIALKPVSQSKVVSFVQKIAAKDSLLYWYKNYDKDSLILALKKGNYIKKHTVKLRRKRQDSVLVHFAFRGSLALDKKIRITSETPLAKIATDKIIVLDKDSTTVAFKPLIVANKDAFLLDFKAKEQESYTVTILPSAITDFFGQVNKDTLTSSFKTKKIIDYGSLKITLENQKTAVFIELLDSKSKLIQSHYLSKNTATTTFSLLKPQTYMVRLRLDTNGNKKWDTGNIIKQQQPEKVVYLPKPLEVRANWDLEEKFVLK